MDKKLSKSVEDNLNRAGRKPGVPNKSTSMAREAIAKFVEGNACLLYTSDAADE